MGADAPTDRSLVAIFGAGRNGSTLLVRLLDGSPGLWLHPPEVNYLCVCDDLARLGRPSIETLQNSTTRPLTALGATLPTDTLVAHYAAHWQEIEVTYVSRLAEAGGARSDPAAPLREREAYGVSEFLPAFLEATRRAYDDREGEPPALVFKTVETPYVADYVRLFPSLRCLHIVREPVANYESAKRTWQYHKSYPFYYGKHDLLRTFLDARWLPHARAIAELERDRERHFVVRYEDLRSEPARVVGEICAWLGVRAPADPEQLTVLGGRRLTRMPSNPSQPGIDPPSRVVADMERQFDYRPVLSERERELIERCTRRYAERLGYESGARRRRAAGFRLWLRWLPPDASERLHVRSRARWAWEMLRRRIYVTRKLTATRKALS